MEGKLRQGKVQEGPGLLYLGGFLGLSWCLLRAILVPLEGSLGAFLGPLGALVGPLGALFELLGGALSQGCKFDRFWVPFWDPKGPPRGTQNRARSSPKSMTILNIEKVPL